MATLTGQSIASSYEQLLHVDNDGGGNGTTHVAVKDGDNGTTFPITLATDAIMITSTNRLEFGDDGTYIHQSADGVLDLVSDTTLELNGGAGSMKINANSRISLSNNDSGGTGGSDSLSGNTIFGYLAGQDIADTGVDNTYFGHNAGSENATGDHNVYLGANAGKGVNGNSNSSNVGIGSGSMLKITTGSENVGIGKTVMDDATSGSGNVAIGTECLMNLTDGNNNVAIGKASLNGSGVNPSNSVAVGNQAGRYAEGNNNVALGQSALKGDNGGNFDGHSNIAIGYEAMDALEDGEEYNIAIGSGAIGAMQEGSAGGDVDHNIAIGLDAFKGGDLDSADNQVQGNIAIGSYALDATGANAQTGTIAIGHSALSGLTSGIRNTAVGYQALSACNNNHYNTAVGWNALYNYDLEHSNTAVGHEAMGGSGASSSCVAIGSQALDGATTSAADGAVAIGVSSLGAVTSGGSNTACGYQSGDTITTGSNNTMIGHNADVSDAGSTNRTALGSGVTVGVNNAVVLGNNHVTDVYMAQDSGAKVHASAMDIEHSGLASGYPLYVFNDGNNPNRFGILVQCGADSLSGAGDAVYMSFKDGDGGDMGGIRNSSNTDLPEFYEGSDERIKDGVKNTEVNALEAINSLKLREFTKKKQSQKTKIGLVAQEVLNSKIPELVGTTSNESYKEYFDESEDKMYTIGTGNMVYYLMKAVQELSAKVTELEKK